MTNSKVLFLDLVSRINLKAQQEEIRSMAYIVLEELFAVSKTEILLGREVEVTDTQIKLLEDIIGRINTAEPIQHILSITEFYGRKFYVDNKVLIPRPETEELVSHVINHIRGRTDNQATRVLDIGTGSGCIPVTLSLEIPGTETFASDISDAALDVARRNSNKWNARVEFVKHDILNEAIPIHDLDVVVSNPPYIARSELKGMDKNVIDFEPHLALFVPDEDPFIFYRNIAAKAKVVLRTNGLLEVEINARFGKEVASVFSAHGYLDIQVIRDVSGNERFVRGIVG